MEIGVIRQARRADLGHEEDAGLREVRGRIREGEHHVAGRQVAVVHALPQEGDARWGAGKERLMFSRQMFLGHDGIPRCSPQNTV